MNEKSTSVECFFVVLCDLDLERLILPDTLTLHLVFFLVCFLPNPRDPEGHCFVISASSVPRKGAHYSDSAHRTFLV